MRANGMRGWPSEDAGRERYLGGLHAFSGHIHHSMVVALAGITVRVPAAVLRVRCGDRGQLGCLAVISIVVVETWSFRVY
jgi:hypothetical protein